MNPRCIRTWILALACVAATCAQAPDDGDIEVRRGASGGDDPGPSGTISGAVTWHGVPVTSADGGGAGGGTGLRVNVPTAPGAPGSGAFLNSDGSYTASSAPVGTYVIAVEPQACTPGGAVLGSTEVQVAENATTTAIIELATLSGKVVGSLATAGVPLGPTRLHIDGTCIFLAGDSTGHFVGFVPPGSYTATVTPFFGSPGTLLGAFGFTVSAGQVRDLGALDFAIGTIGGQVTLQGQPLTGLDAAAISLFSDRDDQSTTPDDTGSWTMSGVPLGFNSVTAVPAGCAPADQLFVGAGTVADVQPYPMVYPVTVELHYGNRLTGTITSGGLPVADPIVTIDGTCAVAASDASGHYATFLNIGSYTGSIGGFGPPIPFQFEFQQPNGETVQADLEVTPSGTAVKSVLDGGVNAVNGATVTFMRVTSPGTTSVTDGSCGASCSPPATGYAIMGLHTWDITTTATYTGSITVCFHYDPGTMSQAMQAAMQLLHDDGVHTCSDGMGGMTPWCNITSGTVDTINHIICGSTTSLSPFAIGVPIEEPDTTPPSISGVPADITAFATSTTGASVTYDPPTATDAVDGAVDVSCLPAAGSVFPPGQTPVTCRATDAAGNPATASFSVMVRYEAATDGSFFRPPINADGSSIFKGATISVKFKLTGASAAIADLTARLLVDRVSAGVTGSELEATSNSAADSGNVFRYDPAERQYIFNLSTKQLSTGTWSLQVQLGDGVPHQVNVSLRAK